MKIRSLQKKSIAYISLIIFIGSVLFFLAKDYKHLGYRSSMSGFEQNQEYQREEMYKKEIPRFYFRRIGHLYLTTGRFVVNRINQEFEKLLNINMYPIIVISLILFTILI